MSSSLEEQPTPANTIESAIEVAGEYGGLLSAYVGSLHAREPEMDKVEIARRANLIARDPFRLMCIGLTIIGDQEIAKVDPSWERLYPNLPISGHIGDCTNETYS